jgi:hypothetical protein
MTRCTDIAATPFPPAFARSRSSVHAPAAGLNLEQRALG